MPRQLAHTEDLECLVDCSMGDDEVFIGQVPCMEVLVRDLAFFVSELISYVGSSGQAYYPLNTLEAVPFRSDAFYMFEEEAGFTASTDKDYKASIEGRVFYA